MKDFLKKFVPDFLLGWYHFGWVFLGAIIYRFSAQKLKVIGVTGTNGKSTVVFLINQILEEAGYQVAALSSIQFKIKAQVWPNNLKMTMPGRLKLQKFLRQAVRAGCQYAVLEITSEGIKQYRHKFIGFDSAVLTNLTPEHLESHGGFENYQKAKAKLFQSLKSNGQMIVNLDDPHSDYFLQFPAAEKWGYTIQRNLGTSLPKREWPSQIAQVVRGSSFVSSQNGISFNVQDTQFNLKLLGKFNAFNALTAIAVGLSEKISLSKIKLALEQIRGLAGRLEIVIKEPFTVIVDYAHTPDALEKVYRTIREVFKGRLIGVLGAAGGGRDKWKRPQLGQIAGKYLDQIIITNEDPYNENPQTIIDEVAAGLKQKQPERILDRRQAIQRALRLAQKGDVVIITGKGCEPWMCVARGKKIPWDDRQVVKEVYNGLSLNL